MRRPLTALPAMLLLACTAGLPLAPGAGPSGSTPAMSPPVRLVAYSEPTLSYGARGAAVRELQQLLRISADGSFGPQTRSAVRTFQSRHGLRVTGSVDGRTWATLRISRLRGVSTARQVVAVTNGSWSSTSSTLRTFTKTGAGWEETFAPMTAWVGRNGFGSPKREGDGQTPVGSFTVPLAFGTSANPGTRLGYRRAGGSDVWVDDVNSSLYNTWQTGQWLGGGYAVVRGARVHAERLYQPTPYSVAFVIGYNLNRTRGAGSAIFLHVSLNRPTAGCVSVPRERVIALLRWLDPRLAPRVVMGPVQAIWN